ncbi:thiamine pyrophosphate-dependent enzyme [Novispirillum sp. DQ9]|uniref:thiamine pyrophosphate-dependent enzyme n=1 Tax=Novispirillum sp. DQ9 TaxID=3398612 RepID=UPI003C79B4E3
MNAISIATAGSRVLLSGNEAVARAAWEAGCLVASAYPGTPSTEILESLARYPDLHAEWAVNEKVALEVAIGASLAGARALCAMKHVGVNVAADPLMSQTLPGVRGGLVIAVADDVGLSSSQNEQDSRFWGRFAHLPVMEPADSAEAHAFLKDAFDLSERFSVPVIFRLTTRVCHVKGMVEVGERTAVPATGFERDTSRWVLVPGNAKRHLPGLFEREERLRAEAEASPLNVVLPGSDTRFGIISSGPAAMNAREAFPDAPIFKLGLSHPLPVEALRAFAATVDEVVVAEEVEPLIEMELKANGVAVRGKDLLPRVGEMAVDVLRAGLAPLSGIDPATLPAPAQVFPRPPTMCAGCPHLSPFYALSKLSRKVVVSGDIGCYTLGVGHPWNAMDTCISMGASLSVANGLEKALAEADPTKRVVAVIGDSTFLHMGMQGLLNLVYNRANVTVLLLDNRAVGMTGGQDHPGTGRDIQGLEAPRVDFVKLVQALGVPAERVKHHDPYDLPGLFKSIRSEVDTDGVSVIITDRPCVLTDWSKPQTALKVEEDACTGCGNCLAVGCPAIVVTRRDQKVANNGQMKDLAFVKVESEFCTGCNACVGVCGPKCLVPVGGSN